MKHLCINILLIVVSSVALLPGSSDAEPFGQDSRFAQRVSMSFNDAEIVEVLRAFSEEYNINIVIEDSIEGKVTANFADTELGGALDAVIDMVGCGWEQKGEIILVFQSRPIRKAFDIDYTISEELLVQIEKLLSEDGKVVFDPASSRLMVIDRPAEVQRVGDLLDLVDPERRQVMIEVRIVEVALDRDDEMGVSWNYMNEAFLGMDDISGQLIQNFAPGASADGSEPSNYDGFEFGLSNDNADFLIQAIAKNSNLDLLSAPRIATLNNQKAIIKAIERVPYVSTKTDIADQGVIQSKEEIEFAEVGIVLEATPQIAPDGGVFLDIRPEVSVVTEWFLGTPVVDERSVETIVKVADGQTIIIGGIIRESTIQGISKIPLLGDIPGLGLLFRYKKDVQTKTELLIFISPQIVSDYATAEQLEIQQTRAREMQAQIKTGLFQ